MPPIVAFRGVGFQPAQQDFRAGWKPAPLSCRSRLLFLECRIDLANLGSGEAIELVNQFVNFAVDFVG